MKPFRKWSQIIRSWLWWFLRLSLILWIFSLEFLWRMLIMSKNKTSFLRMEYLMGLGKMIQLGSHLVWNRNYHYPIQRTNRKTKKIWRNCRKPWYRLISLPHRNQVYINLKKNLLKNFKKIHMHFVCLWQILQRCTHKQKTRNISSIKHWKNLKNVKCNKMNHVKRRLKILYFCLVHYGMILSVWAMSRRQLLHLRNFIMVLGPLRIRTLMNLFSFWRIPIQFRWRCLHFHQCLLARKREH